jgi:hypothetical protein
LALNNLHLDKNSLKSLGPDSRIGKSDPPHLNNMIVDPDPPVQSGDATLQDALHVDVELVRHPVDHVHPDHTDPKGRRRHLKHKGTHMYHTVNLVPSSLTR